MWDCGRPLRKLKQMGNMAQPVDIPTLVPLSEERHVLNKPQEYHSIGEPKKNKMYRPVVPKVFEKSGYDEFLNRIEVNEKRKEKLKSINPLSQLEEGE